MKIKITLIALLCALVTILNGQVPQGFNYQSVMRNAQGNPLLNTPVRIRFTVAEASTNAVLYIENHSTITNNFGLTSLIIGKGTTESGNFSNINWATPKKLVVGIDPTNGTNYTLSSTSDMQSVPFALNASNAVNSQNAVNAQNLVSNVLTINSATQKIGINNNNPAAELTLGNSVTNRKIILYQDDRTSDHDYYGFGINNSILRYQTGNAGGDHVFYSGINATSSKELMRIKGDGRVGIGTTNLNSAAVTLENTDSYERPTLLVRGTASGVFAYTRIRMANADTRFWDIAAFGSANDGRFELVYNNGTAAKSMFTFDRVGNAYAFGSFINSDKNLKKNVLPIGQSLPILMQLSGYRYNWKDEELDPTTQIGFIAQELEKLYPELVRTNDKGLKAVNYIGLIPIVVTAIKEQQQQIEDLKKEVAELKSSIKSIMDKR